MAEQITDYLEGACVWDPYQSAYRKGHSTQTVLIRVLDDVRRAADKNGHHRSLLRHFTKTFDYVNHSILIDKLRTLGFSCPVGSAVICILKVKSCVTW